MDLSNETVDATALNVLTACRRHASALRTPNLPPSNPVSVDQLLAVPTAPYLPLATGSLTSTMRLVGLLSRLTCRSPVMPKCPASGCQYLLGAPMTVAERDASRRRPPLYGSSRQSLSEPKPAL